MNRNTDQLSAGKGSQKPNKAKGCLFIAAIFFGLAFLGGITKMCSGSDYDVNSSDSSSNGTKTESKELSIGQRLKGSLSLISMDPTPISKDAKNATEINLRYALLANVYKDLEKAESEKADSIVSLVKKIKKRLPVYQSKEFPILRKAYANISKNMMWEHDIEVSIMGKNNSKLMLVGAAFATNKNIKTISESMREMVNRLRFKELHFKWYSRQEEYNYLTYDTPSDDSPVEPIQTN
ncbi:hypothetical protein [Sphingobacterium siyangense]|uniref:hypothetical protein n=1 Tax=Sphingobacterium siyangense TaxID=459529 RepID=UPI00301A6812